MHFSHFIQNADIPKILCLDSINVFKEIDERVSAPVASEEMSYSEFLNFDPKISQKVNESTPTNSIINNQQPYNHRPSKKAKRCLFPGSESPKKSYKLIDIYKSFFGSIPMISHHSEDDTINLLKCAVAVNESFCENAMRQAVNLASFQ